MKPAEYWRKSKHWHELIHKEGTVVQTTLIHVPPSAQAIFAPYSFLLVKLEDKVVEVMGTPGTTFKTGERVRLVLRRIASNHASEPIPYGLKAEKI